jgi:glycosyltransferase involved in cell wall biosynthesis
VGGLAHGAGARAVASWPRARRLAREHDITYLNGTVAGRLLPGLRSRATVLHVHDIVDRVPRHWQGADLVLADSRAVASRLDPLEIHVVGLPMELDPPDAPPPWEPGVAGVTGPIIGFVGRLEPRKGALDLCAAAPIIHATLPDARIVILGEEPDDEHLAYAVRVRSSRGVEHFGHVPNVAGVMRHLDVLVHPSLEEPAATVLGEAMAVGTPVVATDVDAVPELVEHGVNGILITPGDVKGLAAGVLRVLEHREEMGAAALRTARARDADSYADHVEALMRLAVEA